MPGRLPKRPCPICGKAVVYEEARYCSAACWSESIAPYRGETIRWGRARPEPAIEYETEEYDVENTS